MCIKPRLVKTLQNYASKGHGVNPNFLVIPEFHDNKILVFDGRYAFFFVTKGYFHYFCGRK